MWKAASRLGVGTLWVVKLLRLHIYQFSVYAMLSADGIELE